MLLDLSFQQENNLLPLFSRTHIIYKQNALYPLLIHIIDKEQPARELVKLRRCTTRAVTDVTRGSVSEGQRASRLTHVDHNWTKFCFHFRLRLRCSVNRHYDSIWCTHHVTFMSPEPQHSDSSLYKMDINHLFATFDFKASQCIFFLLFFWKNTVNQMDCKSMRAGCWEYMFIHYATALLRLGLSPFPLFFLASTSPVWKTFNDLQHASPYLFTSNYQSLTPNWKVKFSKTHKIKAWTSFRMWKKGNEKTSISPFSSHRFPSNTRSLSVLFPSPHFVRSSYVRSSTSTGLCLFLVTGRAQQESTL